MTTPAAGAQTTLRISRTIAAPREAVFRAWTEPEELKRWWGVADGYLTPIAEVDLRVGGRYRLGMQAPDVDSPRVCTGTYREVTPPAKLVYTWAWEPPPSPAGADLPDYARAMVDMGETVVTVEFNDLGGSTEVVLTHEGFPDQGTRDMHGEGWAGCLTQLSKLMSRQAS